MVVAVLPPWFWSGWSKTPALQPIKNRNSEPLEYGITTLSVIPGRSSPSHRAEMSQQLLFGELYRIKERQEEWVKIRTEHDMYPCWIQSSQCHPIDKRRGEALAEDAGQRALPLSFRAYSEDGSPLQLLAGTYFPKEASSPFPAEPEQAIDLGPLEKEGDLILKTARSFLRTPYLWGGRTAFGIDCSGFVQLVFLLHGITIQRDASDQVLEGEALSSLHETKAGDLAFFRNEEGKVVHVGILNGEGDIVHASGMVREDRIDEEGIFQNDGESYTHRLEAFRKIL